MKKPQCGFWFVHARRGHQTVSVAVAAHTARSARVQARKRIGPTFAILEVNPIIYAHAWVMNHGWVPSSGAHQETPKC